MTAAQTLPMEGSGIVVLSRSSEQPHSHSQKDGLKQVQVRLPTIAVFGIKGPVPLVVIVEYQEEMLSGLSESCEYDHWCETI
jgi:hypothetical protein